MSRDRNSIVDTASAGIATTLGFPVMAAPYTPQMGGGGSGGAGNMRIAVGVVDKRSD